MFVAIVIVVLVAMVPVALGLIRMSWLMLLYPLRYVASFFRARPKR